MTDHKGLADMTSLSSLITFTSDRYGTSNSALALNGEGTQLPGGIYFNSPEISISLWIYPQNVNAWSRIIDFGNGPDSNNVVFVLSAGGSYMPQFDIFSASNWIIQATSSQPVTMNQWQFLVATFDGQTAKIYLNGILTSSYPYSFVMPTLQRSICYIGKSEWGDLGSSSFIDDLRFFNKSLMQVDIFELMKQNETSNRHK
jgi:hypothetical protein